jgi:hypothetical protein
MRPTLSAGILLIVLAASETLAGTPEDVTPPNSELCDGQRQVCLRGSLTYYPNPRLLVLNSRVEHAPGPGLLKFQLVGENSDGDKRLTTLEVSIRGNYSEIVNDKLITDHPDVYSWRLVSITFESAAQPDDSGGR